MASPMPRVEPVTTAVFPASQSRLAHFLMPLRKSSSAPLNRGACSMKKACAPGRIRKRALGIMPASAREKAGGVRMSSFPTRTWVGALIRRISLSRVPFQRDQPLALARERSGLVGKG